MADPTSAARRLASEPAAENDERGELREELDRRDAEILRLRDLLIVKDAELGRVRGQLAELESVSRGLMTAAGRVQRIAPWAMRLAGAVLRRLQGRSGSRGG